MCSACQIGLGQRCGDRFVCARATYTPYPLSTPTLGVSPGSKKFLRAPINNTRSSISRAQTRPNMPAGQSETQHARKLTADQGYGWRVPSISLLGLSYRIILARVILQPH